MDGKLFYYLIIYFLVALWNLWNSDPQTREWTYVLGSERARSPTTGPPGNSPFDYFLIICFSNEISNLFIISMFSFFKKIFQNSYTSFIPCIPIWATKKKKKKIPCNSTISVILGSISLVAFSLEWLTLFVLSRHRLYLWHYGLSLWIISLTLWVICCGHSGLLFSSVEFFCLFAY